MLPLHKLHTIEFNWSQVTGLKRYWHWVIGYWAIFADIG